MREYFLLYNMHDFYTLTHSVGYVCLRARVRVKHRSVTTMTMTATRKRTYSQKRKKTTTMLINMTSTNE